MATSEKEAVDLKDKPLIRDAVQYYQKELCQTLNAMHVADSLFTKEILTTQEFENIKLTIQNLKREGQTIKLLNYLLHESNGDKLIGFMEVICEDYGDVFDTLQATMAGMKDGEVPRVMQSKMAGK